MKLHRNYETLKRLGKKTEKYTKKLKCHIFRDPGNGAKTIK
jgi:hypothetical protein